MKVRHARHQLQLAENREVFWANAEQEARAEKRSFGLIRDFKKRRKQASADVSYWEAEVEKLLTAA